MSKKPTGSSLVDALKHTSMILRMMKDNVEGTAGPYRLKMLVDQGGDTDRSSGESGSVFRVYEVTDTRDDSVQYLGLSGSYYSYDGTTWDDTLVPCTLKEMTVTKVLDADGNIVGEIVL